MKITRIKPPKFRVGKYVLNEYELRCLQVEVAKMEQPVGIVVVDEDGDAAIIEESGRLSNPLSGMDICSNFTLELIRIERGGVFKTKK